MSRTYIANIVALRLAPPNQIPLDSTGIRRTPSIADPNGDDDPVCGFAHAELVDPALVNKSYAIKKWLEENPDKPLDVDRGVGESPFPSAGLVKIISWWKYQNL